MGALHWAWNMNILLNKEIINYFIRRDELIMIYTDKQKRIILLTIKKEEQRQ